MGNQIKSSSCFSPSPAFPYFPYQQFFSGKFLFLMNISKSENSLNLLRFLYSRLIGPVLVLVGLILVAVRVMTCTLPTCYSLGDANWGPKPRKD